MKISKYVKLAKRCGHCIVINTETSGTLLGIDTAFYRNEELPEMHGSDQIRAVLDIEPKQAKKIVFMERAAEGIDDVYGWDLSDGFDKTLQAQILQVPVSFKGSYLKALEAEDGELLFYDEDLLSPMNDRIKASDYINLAVRQTEKGQRYIVLMDGFEVLAAILPMQVATEEYLKALYAFANKVKQQNERQRERDMQAENDTEAAGQD